MRTLSLITRLCQYDWGSAREERRKDDVEDACQMSSSMYAILVRRFMICCRQERLLFLVFLRLRRRLRSCQHAANSKAQSCPHASDEVYSWNVRQRWRARSAGGPSESNKLWDIESGERA
jgi:hypothetical protein